MSSDPNWLQMHQALGNQGVMQRVQSRNHFTQGSRPQFTPEERDQKIPDAKNQTGLPDTLKEAMERESRLDLSDVRVHYNSPKPEQFQSLAYAQGNEIHISTGQEKHLPHEAWHIVQQKQGRVHPTLRLNNTPMNTAPELEQEASRMGHKAIAGQFVQRNPSNNTAAGGGTRSSAGAPVQAVRYIVRNGKKVEVPDDYSLDAGQGETWWVPELMQQQPSVTIDSARTEMQFDQQGKQVSKKRKRADAPPTHKQLQKQREKDGQQLRETLKQNPGDLDKHIQGLESLSETLEEDMKLPKSYHKKLKQMSESQSVTGEGFRKAIPNQDEISQSKSTEALHKGFTRKRGDTPPPERKKLDKYGHTMLRVQSAVRIPTNSVAAAVQSGGQVTGQQHPTDKGTPKLQGGSSSHSFSDRQRVSAQNQAFKEYSQVQNVSPNTLVVAPLLAASVSTLSHMSAPHSANNLPAFNPGHHERQHADREQLKRQTNVLASSIGLETNTTTQSYDAPWTAQPTPTSPIREEKEDDESSEEESMEEEESSEEDI
ncbi:DUF4157 domain-containing protein [Alicyclobacillus tolerans]|uniref:eCIS core domain-containing protein n=1 Tax=Alicyclobacillus tolerans TaxID=90970 RepID=UPI001F1C8141|nr:DUF4157 domain-containing protein [Alicyclobacillus tolerans]MCF8565032.1 DUF4157 domain-containing protein [Alicyclobacillus tolerans]